MSKAAIEFAARNLAETHAQTKAVRRRGEDTQAHAGALALIKRLEDELQMIRTELDYAWADLDGGKDWRKFQRHSDQAQQRLHRAIKKLARRK